MNAEETDLKIQAFYDDLFNDPEFIKSYEEELIKNYENYMIFGEVNFGEVIDE